MNRPIAYLAPMAAIGVVTLANAQERFELTGARVAIYNLVGEVTVEQGRGPAVMVELTRGGADGRALTVERGSIGGRETLRVIYPSDDIRYTTRWGRHSTELRVREDGTFGDSDSDRRSGWRDGRRVRIGDDGEFDGRADLKILVPQGQAAEVYLAAGKLDATGVRGTLRLDAAYGAVVDIESGSGGIDLDFPLQTRRMDRNHITGTIGDGRGTLRVDTGSGRVRVLRSQRAQSG